MIERIERLQISGNQVDDSNVEASLETLMEKVNEVVDATNMMMRAYRATNFASHEPNIELVGEGELAYCNRCKGGEVELWDENCTERVKRLNREAERTV